MNNSKATVLNLIDSTQLQVIEKEFCRQLDLFDLPVSRWFQYKGLTVADVDQNDYIENCDISTTFPLHFASSQDRRYYITLKVNNTKNLEPLDILLSTNEIYAHFRTIKYNHLQIPTR